MKMNNFGKIMFLILILFSVQVSSLEINNIQVKDKILEENTDKYKVDVKYPLLLGENKVLEEINKNIEDFTLSWVRNVKLLGEEFNKEYEKEGKEIPKVEADSFYECFYNSEIISIPMTYYEYTGGAHGLTIKISYNYNLKTGEILTLNNLFKDDFNYNEIIDKFIREEILKEPTLYFDEGELFKGVDEKQAYYLSKDGIVIYFQQYEIAPYSSGIREFKIPYEILKEGLKYNINN